LAQTLPVIAAAWQVLFVHWQPATAVQAAALVAYVAHDGEAAAEVIPAGLHVLIPSHWQET
jgi:hypothetical protein